MEDKRTIQVQVNGRLGNQMFQYAFAKYLQHEFYPDAAIKMCFSQVEESGDARNGWENSLKYFHIDDIEVIQKVSLPIWQIAVCSVYYAAKKLIGKKAEDKFQDFLNANGVYTLRKSHYVPVKRSERQSIYVRGRFEAHEYFDSFREELLEKFTPKEPPSPSNAKLLEHIASSESVCVSIRRGDFMDKGNENFNVCGPEYFTNAIERMKQLKPDAKFIVFSDDVDDVKEHFAFPEDTIFESGDDPVYEKLRLMYSCKHFIISNSTFSWWAQYLSRHPGKIVIAPKEWRVGAGDKCRGMYTENMIRI